MPPASRLPGYASDPDSEDADVDALGMQLTVTTVKPRNTHQSKRGGIYESNGLEHDHEQDQEHYHSQEYQEHHHSHHHERDYDGNHEHGHEHERDERDLDREDGEGGSLEQEAPKVLHVLAAVLDRLVARNEQFANSPSQQGKKLTIFHGLRAPSISIAKYLERIFKYTSCSPSCFVVGYVFLDRLIHRQPDLLVTSLNVHRLLVTSVMVATKMLDDVHFNNAFFARVGGVSVVELNRLELEFLFRLDFKLSVSISMFESYCTYLERDVSTVEKRSERSLPAFGNAPPPLPKEAPPLLKKRLPPGLPVSYVSRKQPSLQYQQPLSQYFARDSPPSR